MGKAYYSKEDAKMRLDHTVCMFAGDPVYVDAHSVAGEFKVMIHDLAAIGKHKSKGREVDYTDPRFDYKSPPLGYAYHNGKAYYVTRIPDRRQSQGLIENTLRANGEYLSHYLPMASQAFVNCIKGVYPSLERAIKDVRDHGNESVPFDRRLAIGRVGRGPCTLLYRGKEIGVLNKAGVWELFDIKEKPVLLRVIKDKIKWL